MYACSWAKRSGCGRESVESIFVPTCQCSAFSCSSLGGAASACARGTPMRTSQPLQNYVGWILKWLYKHLTSRSCFTATSGTYGQEATHCDKLLSHSRSCTIVSCHLRHSQHFGCASSRQRLWLSTAFIMNHDN